jgi:ParB/RepB/Spo0J family partition protein
VVRQVPIARIRPEDGLGRRRSKDGHQELRRSIEKFGVLTPITVRIDPEARDSYLLIKGQGRTLACSLLGLETIPAIVVDEAFDEASKVQQFLVENVARLKMRPIDRALLISGARKRGEETAHVAERFGVSAATVRRLEAQLDDATEGEVQALSAGTINLSLHATVARLVPVELRPRVVEALTGVRVRAAQFEEITLAIGWADLVALGARYWDKALQLLIWVCEAFDSATGGSTRSRIERVALGLPSEVEALVGDEREAVSV